MRQMHHKQLDQSGIKWGIVHLLFCTFQQQSFHRYEVYNMWTIAVWQISLWAHYNDRNTQLYTYSMEVILIFTFWIPKISTGLKIALYLLFGYLKLVQV